MRSLSIVLILSFVSGCASSRPPACDLLAEHPRVHASANAIGNARPYAVNVKLELGTPLQLEFSLWTDRPQLGVSRPGAEGIPCEFIVTRSYDEASAWESGQAADAVDDIVMLDTIVKVENVGMTRRALFTYRTLDVDQASGRPIFDQPGVWYVRARFSPVAVPMASGVKRFHLATNVLRVEVEERAGAN